MAIKNINVKNFKSFKEIEINLNKFNVLIGANASGKSNFIQIFKFLRDVIQLGLDNAISLQGGLEYLRNINIGHYENFSVNISMDSDSGFIARRIKKELIGIKTYESNYAFTMMFVNKDKDFEIIQDKLTQKCDFFSFKEYKEELKEKEMLGKGEIIYKNDNGKLSMNIKKPSKVPIEKEDILPKFIMEEKIPLKTLLLENPIVLLHPVEKIFNDFAIYDFDPKLPKKATPITGKADLEEDGSNLSIVLKNITAEKSKKRTFCNLISELLPFIDDVDVERFADKSLLFKLREKYFKSDYLPASFISDGTIHITAMILALFFGKKPITIIEEPERNIHPYLISKLVKLMMDASRKEQMVNKQIIITTHNPEIVKNAGMENLLLVARNEDGFSVVSRPIDKEEVKTFLKNKIGIEELYVQSLLEV